jgi:uncharacterized YccA/Bax inhibitor family protein
MAPSLASEKTIREERRLGYGEMAMNSEGHTDWTSLRLALIASVLTLLGVYLLSYSFSLFQENVAFGQALVAFTAATIVLLLLSVVFAIFDREKSARLVLAIGILAMMASVVTHALTMIDQLAQGWP